MQLILHIGTHKTGTSALQNCLQQNEARLAGEGIHYARMGRSTQANGLARLIAKGYMAEAAAFMSYHVRKAHKVGAHTLLISAESFYAMTVFFHWFNGRKYDYWKAESEAIERLHNIVPQEIDNKLIVFFRRQDHFLEAVYSQVVKGMQCVSTSIYEFGDFFSAALDYHRHMELWTAAFPKFKLYTYEEGAGDISGFFLKNVLICKDTEAYKAVNARVNTRWSRDILEYKKTLNEAKQSSEDKLLNKLSCEKLAQSETGSRNYTYLAPEERINLLAKVRGGNLALNKQFGMRAFPPADSELDGWESYPGLSIHKSEELANRHAEIRRRADYRFERFALLMRKVIRQRLGVMAWIIPLGRVMLPRYNRRPHSRF